MILGVPAIGFDVYVREDKSLLGKAKLLELSPTLEPTTWVEKSLSDEERRYAPAPSVDLLVPNQEHHPACSRAQSGGCHGSVSDRLDGSGGAINLPGFMINHIMRIVTTPRAHDLGYGFLLTRVFEHFGGGVKEEG